MQDQKRKQVDLDFEEYKACQNEYWCESNFEDFKARKLADRNRTSYDKLDKDYLKEVNHTITVDEYIKYLNKHGWTMSEYGLEGHRRNQRRGKYENN